MPKRKSVVRYDTSDVQGEGSWVETRRLTVREVKGLRDVKVESFADLFDLGLQLIPQHVVRWNWADENGDPLPQLDDDAEVLESLTDTEISALSEIVRGLRQPLASKN